jgi:ankyrin repeat protein
MIEDIENMSDESDEKWLPLHQACLAQDAVKVEELIRKDKQPVDQLSNGQTALHIAC